MAWIGTETGGAAPRRSLPSERFRHAPTLACMSELRGRLLHSEWLNLVLAVVMIGYAVLLCVVWVRLMIWANATPGFQVISPAVPWQGPYQIFGIPGALGMGAGWFALLLSAYRWWHENAPPAAIEGNPTEAISAHGNIGQASKM